MPFFIFSLHETPNRRRDSRVSTSASYVPSPCEFQPVARPEFMKPLELIMILQVADYWWASGHPSAFKKNPWFSNDSSHLQILPLMVRCCLAISIVGRPLVRDHPFCHRGFSKIIQHWGTHWLKLIWHTRKPAEYTPPQTNQATSISHKDRCHKKEQRKQQRVSRGNFGYLWRVS